MKDAEKSLKVLIIFCWIVLICYSILKIFNPTAFEIVYNNHSFIEFCNKVDNSKVLQFIVGTISSYICFTLFYLAMIGKYWLSKKELLIFIPTLIIGNIVKVYNQYIGLITDIILSIVLPILFLKMNNRKYILVILIIGNVFDILFQIISMFTRNLGWGFLVDNGSFISIIFSLDVYQMLFLYYLHSNEKRKKVK